jgi:hypothetical protein
MKELHTDIEIQASAERVWQIFTDFASLPQWNPFVRQASGNLETGARLKVRLQPPGGRAMTFRPTLLKVEPGRELRWLGHLVVPGLFDGEHSFLIEPLGPDRVRFTQREVFTGLFAFIFTGSFAANTRLGFEAMNQALKERAEQVTG